jgi:hypothetical protein
LRAITTATAAAAIGIQKKALDNLLGRLDLPEAVSGRQGVDRRIPVTLLPELLLAVEISEQLGVSVRAAFELARRLSDGPIDLGPYLNLRADFAAVRGEVEEQLEVAIETVVRKRRGRPRSTALG